MSKALDLFRKRVLLFTESAHGAQKELIERAGVSKPTLYRWLQGERVPDIEQIEQIAGAMGTTAWELIRPEGAKTAEPTLVELKTQLDRIEAMLRRK